MNIVVAMKQIPDLAQIRIRDQHPVFDDVVYTFGDLDKNALEAAVRLREGGLDAEITLLSIGNEELEDTAKEGLAAGADKAFLLSDDSFDKLDSCQVAQAIAWAVNEIGDVDLLLMGEGSGDEYSGQVVGRVAELLDWPQLGFASSISLEDGVISIDQELEDSVVSVSCGMPAVVSVVADINEARVPAVTQILKAGRKPREVLDADEANDRGLALNGSRVVEVLSSLAPENNREGKIAGSMQEVFDLVKSKNVL